MTEANNLETPKKAKKKKHPFKLVSSNYIFGGIVCLIVAFLHYRTYDFDGFLIGTIIGSLFGIILFSLLMALFFWFILGRKKGGGTITFNVIMALMLFGQFGQFSRSIQDKNKSTQGILNAMSEYKESSLEHPDSIVDSYNKLSTTLNTNLSSLITNSSGDEKKVYIIAQGYLSRYETSYRKWNKAFIEVNNSKTLDFAYLRENTAYDSQLVILDNYISETKNYNKFILNRIPLLKEELKDLTQDSELAKGFMSGVLKKNALQKPIFKSFINTHIAYGNNLKGLVSLFKQEHGKWEILNETLLFEREESAQKYNTLLLEAIKQEEQIDSINRELLKIM